MLANSQFDRSVEHAAAAVLVVNPALPGCDDVRDLPFKIKDRSSSVHCWMFHGIENFRCVSWRDGLMSYMVSTVLLSVYKPAILYFVFFFSYMSSRRFFHLQVVLNENKICNKSWIMGTWNLLEDPRVFLVSIGNHSRI